MKISTVYLGILCVLLSACKGSVNDEVSHDEKGTTSVTVQPISTPNHITDE